MKYVLIFNALVAQLDRALDYESRGQEFESSRAHHNLALYGGFRHYSSNPERYELVRLTIWKFSDFRGASC